MNRSLTREVGSKGSVFAVRSAAIADRKMQAIDAASDRGDLVRDRAGFRKLSLVRLYAVKERRCVNENYEDLDRIRRVGIFAQRSS